MKKFLIAFIVFLGFATSANAQSFGVRLGFPNIGVEYTTYSPGEGTGLKFAIGIAPFTSGVFSAGVSADLVVGRFAPYEIIPMFTVYYGAGAGAQFLSKGTASGLLIDVHLVLGAEFILSPTLTIGAEESPGVGVGFLPTETIFGFKNFVYIFARFKI